VRLPELRTPLARAVVPVLAGLGVIALIALATWGAAYVVARREDPPEQFVPTVIELGSVESRAENVAEDGPILLPGLDTISGQHSIVIDHPLDASPADGWKVYMAHPADQPETCGVTQVKGTAQFTDCLGRTIDVTELAAPPEHVNPVIENRKTLTINLRGFASEPITTSPTTG